MSKVLVIAGMHRSGTSLITQWLNRCGLFVGNKLAGPEIGNTDGLFEDEQFQQLHKQFLKKRNYSPIGFITTSLSPLDVSEKKELKKIIEDNSIPYNPLHDKGFVSIGCAPCTRAIQTGEYFRAG